MLVVKIVGPMLGVSLLANLALAGLWLSARDAIIEEREGCNADKLSQTLRQTRATFNAYKRIAEQREQDLASEAERARNAAEIADEARRLAESRPAQVRTIVREVARETMPQLCLDVPVDPTVRDGVRG